MRVLIADGDTNDLKATRLGLESPDVELLTALDGEEVITKALDFEPDVIVMSASLGALGAFGVSRDLTEACATAGVSRPGIVVLLERDADRWQATQAGVDRALVRPVDSAELDLVVREVAGLALRRGA